MDTTINKKIQNIIDRVEKDGFTITKDGRLSTEMSKKQFIKKKKYGFAYNKRRRESIIYKKL